MFDLAKFEETGLKALRRFVNGIAVRDASIYSTLPVPLYSLPIPPDRGPDLPFFHQDVVIKGSSWYFETGRASEAGSGLFDRARRLIFPRISSSITHPLLVEFLTAAANALQLANISLHSPKYDLTSKTQRRSPGNNNLAGAGKHGDDERHPESLFFIWDDGRAPTKWANGTVAPSHTVMFYCGATEHSTGPVIEALKDVPNLPREMMRLGIRHTMQQ